MSEFCDISVFSKVLHGLWNIFSVFNGNPDPLQYNNFGIRFTIGMFFSFFLFMVIKMRTMTTMKKPHVIAMIGAVLIFIRYTVMLGFLWGFQIGLYDDPMIHFLFPPLEHFFYMMGMGCLAYYSLNHYQYYPGMLKKYVYSLPIIITMFFIYATVEWKTHFISQLPNIIKYKDCGVDWASHLILTIISLYVVLVAVFKYHKNNHYLSAFWTMMLAEHFIRTIVFYYGWEPDWLATSFHAIQIWILPLLTLHFVKAYVIKLGFCEMCQRDVKIPNC